MGEVCRSGEGMWDSAGIGTVGGICNVSSCTTLTVCRNKPLLYVPGACISISR